MSKSNSKQKSKDPDIVQIKKHGDSAVLILTKQLRGLGLEPGKYVKVKSCPNEIVITPLKGVV